MRLVEKHSHLNGEEYLLVHHKETCEEILDVIRQVDAEGLQTKVSKEKTMRGKLLYNPTALNDEFKRMFRDRNWQESRYSYYVTTDYSVMQELIGLSRGTEAILDATGC